MTRHWRLLILVSMCAAQLPFDAALAQGATATDGQSTAAAMSDIKPEETKPEDTGPEVNKTSTTSIDAKPKPTTREPSITPTATTYRIGTVRQMLAAQESGGSIFYVEVVAPGRSICTLVSRSKLVPLLKSFSVATPELLSGQKFQDMEVDPLLALKHQLSLAMESEKYPQLYLRAAAALARMELPSFPESDSKTVAEAFSNAFWERPWLDDLAKQVNELSSGTVRLMRDENPPKTQSGPARYLILTDGHKHVRIAFGPWSSPFIPND